MLLYGLIFGQRGLGGLKALFPHCISGLKNKRWMRQLLLRRWTSPPSSMCPTSISPNIPSPQPPLYNQSEEGSWPETSPIHVLQRWCLTCWVIPAHCVLTVPAGQTGNVLGQEGDLKLKSSVLIDFPLIKLILLGSCLGRLSTGEAATQMSNLWRMCTWCRRGRDTNGLQYDCQMHCPNLGEGRHKTATNLMQWHIKRCSE